MRSDVAQPLLGRCWAQAGFAAARVGDTGVRLGIGFFSNVPADLPVSRVEVRACCHILNVIGLDSGACASSPKRGPESRPWRYDLCCLRVLPCMRAEPWRGCPILMGKMADVNTTVLYATPEQSLRRQAVLVDRSGPVTVIAEPRTASAAERARTQTPPAITPIRAGRPSYSSSSPTTPKGPGQQWAQGLCGSQCSEGRVVHQALV